MTRMVAILLPHAHACPDCHDEFDCFCVEPGVPQQRCPDCWLQLSLLEH